MNSKPSTSSIWNEPQHSLIRINSLRVKFVKLDHGILKIKCVDDRLVSPTQTDMKTSLTFRSELNVIKFEFKLNKGVLQKEFMSKESKKDRISFFKNYLEEERKIIQEKYFETEK